MPDARRILYPLGAFYLKRPAPRVETTAWRNKDCGLWQKGFQVFESTVTNFGRNPRSALNNQAERDAQLLSDVLRQADFQKHILKDHSRNLLALQMKADPGTIQYYQVLNAKQVLSGASIYVRSSGFLRLTRHYD